MKLIQTKKIVEKALTENAVYRDDDKKLVSHIWYNLITSTRDIKSMSAIDLLLALGNDELPGWETIIRARRKLQEMLPDLRGELYEERHKHQKVVLSELAEYEEKGREYHFGEILNSIGD